MKILVIDDEEIIRKLLLDVLKDDGHEVLSVSSGKETYEEFEKISFDLIFTDVYLQEINGVEILRKLKNLKKNLFVVLMESFPDLLAEEAKENGALTCISKPFNLMEIRKVIQKIEYLKKGAEIGT